MNAAAVVMVALLWGQQTEIKPKSSPVDVHQDLRPVTCSEALKVMDGARSVLSHALHTSFGSSKIAGSSQPVSREQVVEEFIGITRALNSQIKFTPKPQAYSKAMFHIKPAETANLETLIRLGYVGKVSPLATNASDSLTIEEFGNVLGFFLCRISELTHMPSPKWSPELGAGSS